MVLWVFGYASLVWKAGFDYEDRIVGFIKNYRRAFHLACFEHRGTPELPARVATLEREEGTYCWGAAYCVKGEEAAKKAIAYLKVRECEYDVQGNADFFTAESPDKPVISNVVVFMSTPDKVKNKYYLGAAPFEDMAIQIAKATGPSGPNHDYIFRLEAALKDIGHEDDEVTELANAVRKMLGDLKSLSYANGDRNMNGVCCSHPSPPNGQTLISVKASTSKNVAPLLSTLSAVVPLSGTSHVSLNHAPCNPRLLKSQAL